MAAQSDAKITPAKIIIATMQVKTASAPYANPTANSPARTQREMPEIRANTLLKSVIIFSFVNAVML
jgi:hypothetical protein